MKTSELIIIVAVLALGVGLTARFFMSPKPSAATVARVEFNLPDLKGKSHSQQEWQGKILVINFWATWCTPCREEIPAFISLQGDYSIDGVQFIGIAIDNVDAVRDFLQTTPSNYPMLIGGDAAIGLAKQWGNAAGALPFTIVVDAQGHIVHQQMGEFPTEELDRLLASLVK